MSMTETWEQKDIWDSVQDGRCTGQHEDIIIVWQKSLVGSLWNENCFWRQHYHIWAIFLGGEIKCKIWYPCSSPLHSEILLAFHISLKCSSWLAKRQPKILKQRIVKQMRKLRSLKKYYPEINEHLNWSYSWSLSSSLKTISKALSIKYRSVSSFSHFSNNPSGSRPCPHCTTEYHHHHIS